MRHSRSIKPVVISKRAPNETIRLAAVVQKTLSNEEYARQALAMHGPIAVELALKDQTPEALAKRIGISDSYLYQIRSGSLRCSINVLRRLLAECEGVER